MLPFLNFRAYIPFATGNTDIPGLQVTAMGIVAQSG
jgi:hypothetical protein